ncbi:MAG: NAD(P)H-dependent oxidoreductase [Candidatus Saccharimonadales bacterium]
MKLAVVIGATRQGRKTVQQAAWVCNTAQQTEGIEAELVDLKDYPMPFFDEPISPRYNPKRVIDPAVKPWLAKLEEFDAYLFVTPEYNHSIPAVLKNALDYVTWEFVHKPAAVVSHGSAGGARAMTDLKEILSESKAAIVPTGPALAITGMSDMIDESGALSEEARANPYGPQAALIDLLTDLQWYSDALSSARAKDQ